MRKLIAFDDDTASKLTELARDRMATFQELADEAFADVLKKHGVPIDLQDALRKSVRASGKNPQENPEKETGKLPAKPGRKTLRVGAQHLHVTRGNQVMTSGVQATEPNDPFEAGQRAARENIPAAGNPYRDGTEEYALWSAGRERVAGAMEADEGEGT
jgi:hypothetical protein